jgi:DNA ligase-1
MALPMREFAALYTELDSTTATNRKLQALQHFFRHADPADAAWAVYFLAGGKPRQAVPTKLLRQFAIERSGLDEWLFEESYQAVGDLAETIAHILPPPTRRTEIGLAGWIEERIGRLRGAAPEAIREALFAWWEELDWRERFLFLKLIGGGFRVGVSRLLVTRALGEVGGIDPKRVAQRLMGWTDKSFAPTAPHFLDLISSRQDEQSTQRGGQPFPFFLAHPLQVDPETLGPVAAWQLEWKYDGIRAQLVRRQGQSWLWSRGEDLVSERFPEISAIPLPDGSVVDGEVLVWRDGAPASFAELQKRIGRKTVSAKLLAELPAVLVAYDLLERDGVDLRALPQSTRRGMLETLVCEVDAPALKLSPLVEAESWEALGLLRASSRERGVEGMMLKATDARYGTGRTREGGVWWKWKVDPYTVDAVLIYAQAGQGRRASLYKAYSGLTDAEIGRVDAAIRKTTVEKFGPVRSVKPTMVFELGFEGIALSPRHKAGIAVRFPRILRMREDKPIEEADTLATLRGLLP